MDLSEYQTIRNYEDSHWWYVATHRVVMREIEKLRNRTCVLDAGCGTGGLLELLHGSFKVAGFDGSIEAVRKSRKREGLHGSVALGYVESIPFQNRFFDGVTCIDVIYHRNVADEKAAVREIHRVMKPGGVLVLQVPAFECLRGGHDEAVHTRKRYRLSEMRSLLDRAGFRVVHLRYRYPWLFLPAFFVRKLTRGSGKSDLQPVNGIINAFLLYLARFFDSPSFARLPFGTSVFAVAEKI